MSNLVDLYGERAATHADRYHTSLRAILKHKEVDIIGRCFEHMRPDHPAIRVLHTDD